MLGRFPNVPLFAFDFNASPNRLIVAFPALTALEFSPELLSEWAFRDLALFELRIPATPTPAIDLPALLFLPAVNAARWTDAQ